MAIMESERIFWTEHISQWRQSPQKSKVFCRDRELDFNIFHAWRKKLEREKRKNNSSLMVPKSFIPIISAKKECASEAIAQEIKLELGKGIRVCWLVSGFSELAQQLREMELL
jgi:hypothetical protein